MKFSETNQKPIRRVLQFTMLAVIASGIAACSDFQRAIGSKKSSPDEFEVVVRPPLSLPPGFANTPDDIREEEETAAQDRPGQQPHIVVARRARLGQLGLEGPREQRVAVLDGGGGRHPELRRHAHPLAQPERSLVGEAVRAYLALVK